MALVHTSCRGCTPARRCLGKANPVLGSVLLALDLSAALYVLRRTCSGGRFSSLLLPGRFSNPAAMLLAAAGNVCFLMEFRMEFRISGALCTSCFHRCLCEGNLPGSCRTASASSRTSVLIYTQERRAGRSVENVFDAPRRTDQDVRWCCLEAFEALAPGVRESEPGSPPRTRHWITGSRDGKLEAGNKCEPNADIGRQARYSVPE